MEKGASFPLVGGSFLLRSRVLDSQRCLNFFPVGTESGTAKAPSALYGTPGLRRLLTLTGTGGIRALYVPSKGDAIAVRGPRVYRVDRAWTPTLVGLIADLNSIVSIADDGSTAVLVDGPHGYKLSLTPNTLEQITDESFRGADAVYWINTVFVFNAPGTSQFYTTEGDGVTFNALDYADATSNAEPLVRHIVNHRELVLFKKTTAEIWRAGGAPDFFFLPDTNASIEKGCDAKNSVVDMDNTIYWLGGDADGGGIVWRLNGYTPQRVSNEGLEYAIAGYGDVSDAEAYSYQQEGHTFYVLTFPTANATWSYDVSTGLWHERAYRNPVSAAWGRHRSRCHMFYAGLHVVGDYEDGRIYALDLDHMYDDTDPLVSLRSAPHLSSARGNEIRYNALHVDLEAGVGLETGQGSDPILMVRWSNDGGRTWSSIKSVRMGAIGETHKHVMIDRLGMGRDRVFEISISDPVKRAILGGTVDAVDTGR